MAYFNTQGQGYVLSKSVSICNIALLLRSKAPHFRYLRRSQLRLWRALISKWKQKRYLNASLYMLWMSNMIEARHNFQRVCNHILSCKHSISLVFTAQKMKFSIRDFFSKCDQIRSFALGISSVNMTQVFSCEFCEIFKTSFFLEQFWWLLLKMFTLTQRRPLTL